jgi:hypothetical protein
MLRSYPKIKYVASNVAERVTDSLPKDHDLPDIRDPTMLKWGHVATNQWPQTPNARCVASSNPLDTEHPKQ